MENWGEVLLAAQERRLDVVSAIARNDEREAYLLFTDEFIRAPQAIFTRDDAPFINGLDALSGHTAAVVKDYFIEGELRARYPEIEIVSVGGVQEGVELVSRGKVFAYVGNLTVTGHNIQQAGLSNLKVAASTDLVHRLHFGVRKDWPELVGLMNKALDHLDPEETNRITHRWMSLRLEGEFDYSLFWKIGGAWCC